MSDELPDRNAAFRTLINAAWRFLDQTKEHRELQEMEAYRDLAQATNEAGAASAR